MMMDLSGDATKLQKNPIGQEKQDINIIQDRLIAMFESDRGTSEQCCHVSR